MLPATDQMPLLLSGTAAIVGHASQHAGDLRAQLDEIFRNLGAVLGVARAQRPNLPAEFGCGSRLKVYVRDRHEFAKIEAMLRDRFGDAVPRLVLHAAICRRELAVEVEAAHGGALMRSGP